MHKVLYDPRKTNEDHYFNMAAWKFHAAMFNQILEDHLLTCQQSETVDIYIYMYALSLMQACLLC